jgi:hypothetical protein
VSSQDVPELMTGRPDEFCHISRGEMMIFTYSRGLLLAGSLCLLLVGACAKEKPTSGAAPARVVTPAPKRTGMSARRYEELLAIVLMAPPEKRREALAGSIASSEYEIYEEEINQALSGLFTVSQDKRVELVTRSLAPLFESIDSEAWASLPMVSPLRRGEALMRACRQDGKPVVDPFLADHVDFEILLLSMAMAHEALVEGFADEKGHRLALTVMLDPEFSFLLPPPPEDKPETQVAIDAERVLAVTLTPTALRVGIDEVVALDCRFEGEPCTESHLARMEKCAWVPDDSVCSGTWLTVPKEFKEDFNPNSLLIAPLRTHLKVRLDGKIDALKKLARTFKGRLSLFVHPEIPFRLLVEVLYTAGRAGDGGRGSLDEWRLRTFPRVLEPGAEYREFRLPRVATHNSIRQVIPAVLVGKDRIILKIPQGPDGEGTAIDHVFNKKRQSSCEQDGWVAENREEYDYAALYSALVKLRNNGPSGLGYTIHLGAEDGIPWRVLSRVFDTVTMLREKDSYDDLCEFLKARRRTEEGQDVEGNLSRIPMDLFPRVVLVVL